MKKCAQYKYLIGIDEVGRGPIAGPVAVGVVKLKACPVRGRSRATVGSNGVESLKINTEWARGFRDSKKLTPRARGEWFAKIKQAQSEGWLEYAVAFVAPSVIDRNGIVYAINAALVRALEVVESQGRALTQILKDRPWDTRVLLDGGLRAPARYGDQETIIKGDEKELVIALASIVAKVTRDKKMVALAKKHPHHGFEKHKGYGTRAHYEAIKKYGVTPHHRKSFLKD